MSKGIRRKQPRRPRGSASPGFPHSKKPSDPSVEQANALIREILAQLNRGNVGEGMRLIEAGMQVAPLHPEFPHLAGQVLIRLPEPDRGKARYWLERAVELSPGTGRYRITLAHALIVDGEFEQALSHSRQALRADPRSSEAHTTVGIALAKLNRKRDAAEAFSNAARLQPDNPDLWTNLALCHMELSDADGVVEAMAHIERLVSDPSAELLQELGKIYRGLGRHATTERYLRQAIEKEPSSSHAWFALAEVLSQAGDPDAASDALEQAERLGYPECAIRYTQARILGQQRSVDQAKTRLEEALALAGDDVGKLRAIAKEYAQLGDFDAQRRCLEQALQINPQDVRAFAALAIAPGRAIDRDQLSRLEQIAQDPAIDTATRGRVAFTLGDNYRYENDFDRSFRYYRLGNRLKGFKFDELAYRDWQSRVETAYTKELLATRSARGNPSRLPVLIVGMPRSGTTLTEQIVSSHPAIYGAGEYGTVARLAKAGDLSMAGVDAPIDGLVSASDAQLALYAANYLKAMIAEAGSDKVHVINKLPHNFQQVGLFALLFPNAPVIHITRDPRDNLLSIYFQDFVSAHQYAYDLKALGRYYRLYERLMAHWASVLPNPMLELQYEELVADLPGKTAELAEFVGVDLDERMLRFWEQERKVETMSQWQVRQPLYTSSIGRWKPYEKHLKPLFDELGL